MNDLLAARLQMSLSLGFHIIFACIGMVMPFLMVVAHHYWISSRDPIYKELTKAWSRGLAIFFATGAVSGTLLSFELGLLWPTFMEHAGPIFGLPFSLEGTAFFVEAIALGLFLYGWDHLSPRLHWWMGLLVGISGVVSGILVVAANGWMNSPTGFTYNRGVFSDIDPWKAMFNDAWFHQSLHMTLAAFVATGFAVTGLHAYLLLRRPESLFHKKAISIALPIASVAIILQIISGDLIAKDVARRQPIKLAAMEAHFQTTEGAPIILGGIVDQERAVVEYGITIPYLLSFLAKGDFNAEVQGLNDFPREHWPPVMVTHSAFEIMVGTGTVLAVIAVIFMAFYGYRRYRHKQNGTNLYIDIPPLLLRILAMSAPLGFVSLEAGWVVTEVGRQPWIIYQVLKTSESLTPMPGLVYSFILYCLVYATLIAVLVVLMVRQIGVVEQRKL